MACEYCDGSEKNLIVQRLSDASLNSAFICPDGAPSICICVDYQWVYLAANYCPMCGRDLRGDNHD